MAQRTGLVEEMTSAEIETLATVLGVSAKAIAVALQDFARELEGHTTAFNSWASRQEEIACPTGTAEAEREAVAGTCEVTVAPRVKRNFENDEDNNRRDDLGSRRRDARERASLPER